MLAFIRTLVLFTVFLTLCAFSIAFALSNKALVTIILPWVNLSISLPLFLLVIATLLLGGFGAGMLLWMMAFPKQRALKRSEKTQRRTVSAQRQEIEALRLESRYGQPYADSR